MQVPSAVEGPPQDRVDDGLPLGVVRGPPWDVVSIPV